MIVCICHGINDHAAPGHRDDGASTMSELVCATGCPPVAAAAAPTALAMCWTRGWRNGCRWLPESGPQLPDRTISILQEARLNWAYPAFSVKSTTGILTILCPLPFVICTKS